MSDTQHAKLYTVETVLEPNYIQNKNNIIEKSLVVVKFISQQQMGLEIQKYSIMSTNEKTRIRPF